MGKTINLFITEKLNELEYTKYRLHKETGIAFSSIDRYCNNEVERYDKDILLKICLALKCKPSDIIKIVDEE